MKKYVVFTFIFFMSLGLFGQAISISNSSSTPDPSSILDIKSFSKGLLIPRMTSMQKLAIVNPANGLIIYEITTNDLWVNQGTPTSPNWTKLIQQQLWSQSGPNSIFNSSLIDNVGIGIPNSTFKLHVSGTDPMGTTVPLVALDNNIIAANPYTSILFSNSIAQDYTIGADHGEIDAAGNIGTFKITKGSQLAVSSQGDSKTMIRALPSGIIDFSNQSRARAFQQKIPTYPPTSSEYGQPIKYKTWTPVFYNLSSYDQQLELTLAPYPTYPFVVTLNPPAVPTPPIQSFFMAKEDGYYIVNARVDFAYKEYTVINEDVEISDINQNPEFGGYVSIAIGVENQNGDLYIYSQGNKLMGAQDANGILQDQNNLAPNVSDIVYLKSGESISIWVWQSIYSGPSSNGAIPLRILNPDNSPWSTPELLFPSQVYVSIHKGS